MFAILYEEPTWVLVVSAAQRLACPASEEVPTPNARQIEYLRDVASFLLAPGPRACSTPPRGLPHPMVCLTEATFARRMGDPGPAAELSPPDAALPWLEALFAAERAEAMRLLGDYAAAAAVLTTTLGHTDPLSELDAFCQMSLRRRQALVMRSTGAYRDAARAGEAVTTLGRHFPALRTSAEYAKQLAATAELVRSAGRPATALPLARKAYHALSGALGPRHPDVASQLGNIGETLRALGRTRAAVRAYRACVDGLLETLGPDHPEVGKRLLNLAHGHRQSGDLSAARIYALYGRCVLRAAYGDEHHHVAKADAAVAGLGLPTGLTDAVAGLSIRAACLPPNHHHVHRSLRQVATILRESGHASAAEYLNRGAAELEQTRQLEETIHGTL